MTKQQRRIPERERKRERGSTLFSAEAVIGKAESKMRDPNESRCGGLILMVWFWLSPLPFGRVKGFDVVAFGTEGLKSEILQKPQRKKANKQRSGRSHKGGGGGRAFFLPRRGWQES